MSDKLREALNVIGSMPMREQDNMVAANMRKIAVEALSADDAARGTMREAFEAWCADQYGRADAFTRAQDGYISDVPHLALSSLYASVQMLWEAWQAATRAAAPIPVPNSRQLSEVIAEYEAMPERAAALADARASLKAAAPQGAEPVWIQPDHLQKARRAPFLCRVEPAHRDDFVPLYTSPPAAPTDAEWEAEHLRLVRSYGKVCWAAGAGGDAIACLAIADALGALRAHLSTRPQQAAPTEADRLDAQRWRRLTLMPSEANSAGDDSHIAVFVPISAFEFGEEPPSLEAAIDAAMSAQAGDEEQ